MNFSRAIKAAIYTLGCKVNSYESTAIAEMLRNDGIEIVENCKNVDIGIINTCAVTSEAERKSRQIIRRMKSLSPNAYIIVTGCSAQLDSDKIAKIEGVSAVCGNREKLDAARIALEYAKKLRSEKDLKEAEKTIICSCELEGAPFESMNITSSERTRAVLKIEDGCESKCAYCIIPKLRGKIRSKAPEDVIREAKKLSENGYSEIVLTGIEVSAYGKDFAIRDGLISLIEELDKISNIKRIRLGSFDPSAINENFIDRAAKISSFTPHFHLSLQSGCDNTLFSMKRRYNTEQVRKKVNYIREKMPSVMFTSDIIVGFPGESDADFEETQKFLNELDLLSFHIFAYSKRPGTPAAEMKDQISSEVKSTRMKALEALRDKMTKRILDSQIGKKLDIIVEEYKDGFAVGHSANFIQISAENTDNDLHGKVITVLCKRQENGILYGTRVL